MADPVKSGPSAAVPRVTAETCPDARYADILQCHTADTRRSEMPVWASVAVVWRNFQSGARTRVHGQQPGEERKPMAVEASETTVADARRSGRLVYRQSAWTRATHWIWAVTIFFMVTSGLSIFNARPDLYIGQQSGFGFDNAILDIHAERTDSGKIIGVTDLVRPPLRYDRHPRRQRRSRQPGHPRLSRPGRPFLPITTSPPGAWFISSLPGCWSPRCSCGSSPRW